DASCVAAGTGFTGWVAGGALACGAVAGGTTGTTAWVVVFDDVPSPTTTAPTMPGCSRQAYGETPEAWNRYVAGSPTPRSLPSPHLPATRVTVWATESSFVHVMVWPGCTRRTFGTKQKSLRSTWTPRWSVSVSPP